MTYEEARAKCRHDKMTELMDITRGARNDLAAFLLEKNPNLLDKIPTEKLTARLKEVKLGYKKKEDFIRKYKNWRIFELA